MRVYISNKFVSFGGDSTVKDENGNNIYFVNGKFLSPLHVKWVCDMQKHKLFKVRKEFKWNASDNKAFIYDESKTKIATVRRIRFSGRKFTVEGYRDEISIEFVDRHTGTITRNGKIIGRIDRTYEHAVKQFLFSKDSFCLEAEDEKDIPFLIALVIALDILTD